MCTMSTAAWSHVIRISCCYPTPLHNTCGSCLSPAFPILTTVTPDAKQFNVKTISNHFTLFLLFGFPNFFQIHVVRFSQILSHYLLISDNLLLQVTGNSPNSKSPPPFLPITQCIVKYLCLFHTFSPSPIFPLRISHPVSLYLSPLLNIQNHIFYTTCPPSTHLLLSLLSRRLQHQLTVILTYSFLTCQPSTTTESSGVSSNLPTVSVFVIIGPYSSGFSIRCFVVLSIVSSKRRLCTV